MTAWITAHATAAAISGATLTTVIAFALFGLAGAFIAWGLYGVATYAIAGAKKNA